MPARDYLKTDDNDLLIRDGDFVVGDSTEQHQKDLLLARPGSYRFAPLTGVNLENWINDDDLSGLQRIINRVFRGDGMTVRRLEIFENGKILIIAPYL